IFEKEMIILGSDEKVDNPSIWVSLGLGFIALIFYFLIYLTTVIQDKNSFDTLAYPVGFYVFCNILIRNLVNEIESKRLSDLNDGFLISYVIVYLIYGTSINFLWFWLFLLSYLALIILFIILFLGFNKNSVWHKNK
ncbi:hypothetical protein, partial [Staphylococcus warneri]|uniref:hypothetical protein n=1 Tax=Staphylococcus warneri TaxID=1292 RepID=UPI001F3FC824